MKLIVIKNWLLQKQDFFFLHQRVSWNFFVGTTNLSLRRNFNWGFYLKSRFKVTNRHNWQIEGLTFQLKRSKKIKFSQVRRLQQNPLDTLNVIWYFLASSFKNCISFVYHCVGFVFQLSWNKNILKLIFSSIVLSAEF